MLIDVTIEFFFFFYNSYLISISNGGSETSYVTHNEPNLNI